MNPGSDALGAAEAGLRDVAHHLLPTLVVGVALPVDGGYTAV